MKCSELRRRLSAYSDGEAPAPVRAEIVRHLDECPVCRRELERLTDLRAELVRIEDVEVRPYLAIRVKQRIADRKTRRAAQGWLGRIAIPAGALAVVMLTALGGSYLGRIVSGWRQPASATTRTSPFVDPAGGTLISVAGQLFSGSSGE